MSYVPPSSDWSNRVGILTSMFNKELQKEEKKGNKVKGIVLFSICILILTILVSCFIFL